MAAAGHAPLNVLVVEDHPDIADSLAYLLRADGHAVRVARDGMSAVDLAMADPPDVMLLDIGLPSVNGWAVARQVAAGIPGRPPLFIAISAYDGPEQRAMSDAAGIAVHLAKPADPVRVLQLLRDHQRGGASQPTSQSHQASA